jgi:hypothetical protein
MRLPHHARKIVCFRGCGGEDQIDGRAGDETKIGEIAHVELHPNLGLVGGLAAGVDGIVGRVDRDRAGTETSERDRRACRVAQDEYALGRHVSAEAQLGFGR